MSDGNPSSVHRTVNLLQVLGSPDIDPRQGLGVVEIARRVGREKSQVSRALKSLSETGFVERDPDTRRYRLGWEFFALAANAGESWVRSAGPTVLRRLVGAVKVASYLSVLRDHSALTVLSESPRVNGRGGWVGRTAPLHVTAVGRVLLMDRPRDETTALLDGVSFGNAGPHAPRDLDDLLARTAEARRTGYAVADEEFRPGLVAIAAPVRDLSGQIVAAVNVSAPKYRLGPQTDRLGPVVMDASRQLTAAMCGRP